MRADTGAGTGVDVWGALRRGPRRFLLSAWPWRAFGYLLTGGVLGVGWLALAFGLALAGVVLLPVGVGVLALLCVPVSAAWFATLERSRLRWMGAGEERRPEEESGARNGRGRVRALWRRAKSPATWVEFGFALLNAVLAVVDLGVVVVLSFVVVSQPLALLLVAGGEEVMYGQGLVLSTPAEVLPWLLLTPVFAVLAAYLLAACAGARASLARAVLVRPRREAELGARLVEVRASRARMAEAFEGERRRIERDLHDGAQQRLTALVMTLGLAKLDADPALVGRAQDEARAALDELRDLVRGIHPSVLTDRGLGAAVESLAERSTLPVDVDVAALEERRPPPGVEAAAYFAVAEALTNAAKHGGARRAAVRAAFEDGDDADGGAAELLVVEIRDDGRGGADPSGGTGLTGLADRLAAQDGRLRLSSPEGGPTVVRLELPSQTVVRSGRPEK